MLEYAVRIVLVLAALLLILTLRWTEEPVSRLIGLFLPAEEGAELSSASSMGAEAAEEDILDNRKKWRLLIIGGAVNALLIAGLLISVFTLNRKINTLYGSIRNLELTVQEMQAVSGAE